MSLASSPWSQTATTPIRLLRTSHVGARITRPFSECSSTRSYSRHTPRCSKRPELPRCQWTNRRSSPMSSRRHFHASPTSYATRDPYRVLGVDKNASASEIKKAYYTLAKKYHPDTSKEANAKDRFAEAQSAYELLSDPKKKEAWDQFGAAAFDQGAGFDPSGAGAGAGGNPFAGAGAGGFGGFGGGGGFSADFSFEDLFSAFGGGGRRGRGSRGSPFQQEILVGDNIEVQTSISFMDAAKGTSKPITITPLVQCRTCSGSGLKSGTKRSKCPRCDGTGTRVHFMSSGFQMASTCDNCGGQGVVIPRGQECGTCSGNGVVRDRRTVKIDIPPGIDDGVRLRIPGEGDAPAIGLAPGQDTRSARGDLYVFVRVMSDVRFTRQGADVLHMASIPVTTALLGGQITVPTLEGDIRVKVPKGTNAGDHLTISNKGMRRLGGRGSPRGDLRVEFRVMIPKSLSANQRTLVEMLADEVNDTSATRTITNMGKTSPSSSSGASGSSSGSSTSNSPKPSSSSSSSSSSPGSHSSSPNESSHENEGFLRSVWHRLTDNLTHHHDQQQQQKTGSSNSDQSKPDEAEEPPKRASGSG